MFWVISVYFNIRNTLPKFGTFLLGHPVYIYIYIYIHILLFIEHNWDVSPENVSVSKCRPCVMNIAAPVVVESPSGII